MTFECLVLMSALSLQCVRHMTCYTLSPNNCLWCIDKGIVFTPLLEVGFQHSGLLIINMMKFHPSNRGTGQQFSMEDLFHVTWYTNSIFTQFYSQEYFTLGVKFSRVKMKSGGWKFYVVFRSAIGVAEQL